MIREPRGGLTAQLLEDLLDIWGGTRHLVVILHSVLGWKTME